MRSPLFIVALTAFLLLSSPSPAQDAPGAADPGVQAPTRKKTQRAPLYDESADARRQIAEALARAKRENRRVLVQWGANWCGWCHLLHDAFEKNPEIKRKLQYEYELVLVDIGRWDKNLDLVKRYDADIEGSGVPYLTVLDADGKPLANQETGSLEAKIDGRNGHDPKKVLSFLEKHQAPYRSAESILADALTEAQRSGRKVFLHFGAPWCVWCHRFEGWMARKQVVAILATDFVEVKIDVDRTIGGKAIMEHYAGAQPQGIPWFAFLDADGTVLAKSDASGNNLGCPYTDEEIEAFVEMLGHVTVNVTDDQLATLASELRTLRKEKSGH